MDVLDREAPGCWEATQSVSLLGDVAPGREMKLSVTAWSLSPPGPRTAALESLGAVLDVLLIRMRC